jgi:hypothetical protein
MITACRSSLADIASEGSAELGVAQHDGVDQAENRRVRTDPQRQRDDGDSGKAGDLAQHAQAEADILEQPFMGDPPQNSGFPEFSSNEVWQFACRLQEKGRPLSGGRKADFRRSAGRGKLSGYGQGCPKVDSCSASGPPKDSSL